VTTEIVHDDDVTFAQRRHKHRGDVGAKGLAIDRPLQKPGRIDPIEAQRSDKSHGLPASLRGLSGQALAAESPAAQRGHVGLGPGLVDEDQALRLDATLILCPLRASPRHVGTIAFGGHQAFF